MSALDLIADVVRLRAGLQALWHRRMWEDVPPPVHPAAVSDAEVDQILFGPQAGIDAKLAFFDGHPQAGGLIAELVAAEARLDRDADWRRLIDRFGLGRRERHLLACAVAVAARPFLSRVFAYLHDQGELVHASAWLAASLFDDRAPARLTADAPLLRWHLVHAAADVIAVPDTLHGWVADRAIVDFLAGVPPTAAPALDGAVVLYPELAEAIHGFLALRGGPSAPLLAVELVGPPGGGRKTLARQVAAALERPVRVVTASALLEGALEGQAAGRVRDAARDALLHDVVLVWDEDISVPDAARAALEHAEAPVFALRETSAPPQPGSRWLWRSFDMPALTRAQRSGLWSTLTPAPCPPEVRDWALTPGEIGRLVQVAPAGADAVRQACRRPAESLGLLSSLPLPFSRDDLIVPDSIRGQLDAIEEQVRLRWDVYEDWGFERLCPNGRGIVALFAGPSGTGKTMAAQVLARTLGLELYRLDLSQVVNKYIGETEKRLKTVFDTCDRAHFMLLVDECEGLFGQRFNSRDAHDRYANLEIDYLLQRLERFQGVAVLSTNRKSDIDGAFLRRIRFVVDFLLPGVRERVALWQSAIPETSPAGEILRDTIAWDTLGEKAALTGAEIKLAALNAAFIARSHEARIGMPHIVTAIRRELAKKGQTLRGFE